MGGYHGCWYDAPSGPQLLLKNMPVPNARAFGYPYGTGYPTGAQYGAGLAYTGPPIGAHGAPPIVTIPPGTPKEQDESKVTINIATKRSA
jgi:hypothetical protein